MLFMTWIARVGDGLPLAASIPEDEESGKGVLDFQNQAKMLFRKMNQQSPSKCTIETGSHFFHYLIHQDVCYLVLCEQSYSKKLAFSFLEDLAQEFSSLYGKKVQSVNRPYSFIEFDTYIQKARRSFMDSRTRRNLTAINTELQDVQRIMVRNIDDVLQRGSLLSDLDNKAQTLSLSSQRYKKDARNLNMQSMYAKIGAAAIVMLVFVLYFWVFNLHHKLLVNRIRAADAKQHETQGSKKPNDRRWEAQHYTWNVDDDEEIPGTVRIVLSAADPQRTKNQVVYIADIRPEADFGTSDADDTASEAYDGDRSVDTAAGQGGAAGNNTSGGPLDSSRSDHGAMTEREDDPLELLSGVKSLVKRKGAKGINHFSYCDRATQTTVPPIRSHAIQTEAPPRVCFTSLTNAWIIHDAYHQDLAAQQQKTQQQALINSAAEAVNKGGVPSTTSSSTAAVGSVPDASATTAAPPLAPTVVFQPTGETALSPAGVARLDSSAHVIERMLNQNTYDDIAQDFKYWEDAADEYREPEGTLMPLWRFTPPATLLRMFEENGSMRNAVPSHITAICWNPHYKDLFAIGLGSRDNMTAESGLVCVFSLKSPTHPERSVQLQAGVSSLDFHPEFWQLLAVGMHDGHVAVIDLTVRRDLETFSVSNLITYRSSAMRGKRTVPITQGELYPTELITLPFQGDNRLQDNSFADLALTVGTAQGQLWPVSNEGEILNWGPVNAHQGPVYTVQWNPFHHQVFITCGTDWLVKIWDQRESSTAFACMSSNGKVLIYDLNICLHKPLCSQRITPQRRAQPTILSFAPFHPVILVGDDK
uniref:EOG090X0HBC n=1 Tax=Daphnia dolichocephala TaxID=2282166 RepID=A0A4Y7M617_9CRUS|nr:EOG090X0HBC [Daphnia dolichocephala]